jgi:hypothetical protein
MFTAAKNFVINGTINGINYIKQAPIIPAFALWETYQTATDQNNPDNNTWSGWINNIAFTAITPFKVPILNYAATILLTTVGTTTAAYLGIASTTLSPITVGLLTVTATAAITYGAYKTAQLVYNTITTTGQESIILESAQDINQAAIDLKAKRREEVKKLKNNFHMDKKISDLEHRLNQALLKLAEQAKKNPEPEMLINNNKKRIINSL